MQVTRWPANIRLFPEKIQQTQITTKIKISQAANEKIIPEHTTWRGETMTRFVFSRPRPGSNGRGQEPHDVNVSRARPQNMSGMGHLTAYVCRTRSTRVRCTRLFPFVYGMKFLARFANIFRYDERNIDTRKIYYSQNYFPQICTSLRPIYKLTFDCQQFQS